MPLDCPKSKWETDFNELITEDTWHEIIQDIFHLSKLYTACTGLKLGFNIDPSCDQCGQDQVNLLYMICPKLCTFWQSIFKTFSNIFGTVLAPSPFIVLFGVALMDSPFGLWDRDAWVQEYCNVNLSWCPLTLSPYVFSFLCLAMGFCTVNTVALVLEFGGGWDEVREYLLSCSCFV